jgi:hypothetical protein
MQIMVLDIIIFQPMILFCGDNQQDIIMFHLIMEPRIIFINALMQVRLDLILIQTMELDFIIPLRSTV